MPDTPDKRMLSIDIRYWEQNAANAIRDIYDALVELVTNPDDRYSILKRKRGKIEIEVERKRGVEASIVRIRDFADGMTREDMERKLLRVGTSVSGIEEGESVRGAMSRGAKDVAILGKVVFESFAKDGNFHYCEINKFAVCQLFSDIDKNIELHRVRTKILEGTGTLVTLYIDREHIIPQHEVLERDLSRLVPLRDIISEREITLYDINKKRQTLLTLPILEGKDRLKETFKIPEYPGAEAKLIIKRSKDKIVSSSHRFRLNGIIVKSKHAIHESTYFSPELDDDPYAQWYFGRLTCEYLDDLWNAYEDTRKKRLPVDPKNPSWIYDPNRKTGLRREHPFVKSLFQEVLKRLRPLVEQERKQAESKVKKIENHNTRKRLDSLQKLAAKFMSENIETDDESRDGEDLKDSKFRNKGYSFSPKYSQVIVGESQRFYLTIKQEVFPELSVGDSIQIHCEGCEIESDKSFDILEIHPTEIGLLRSTWKVKGLAPTKAAGVKIQIGSIVDEAILEVFETEQDKYKDIKTFSFNRERYSISEDKYRNFYLLAPSPSIVGSNIVVTLDYDIDKIEIKGDRTMIVKPEKGIAICKMKMRAKKQDICEKISAVIPDYSASADIVSIPSFGSENKFKIEDRVLGDRRFHWKGNECEIMARHSILKRYFVNPPHFPEQDEMQFRILIAEIITDAVCFRIMQLNESSNPKYYDANDWETYYREYSRLMTSFGPLAHESQTKI